MSNGTELSDTVDDLKDQIYVLKGERDSWKQMVLSNETRIKQMEMEVKELKDEIRNLRDFMNLEDWV